MLKKFNKKYSFFLSLLIASSSCYAQINAPRLTCPSLDFLHENSNSFTETKLDTDGSYTVCSDKFMVEDKTSSLWFGTVGNVSAKSNQDSISMTQKILRNLNTTAPAYPYKVKLVGSDNEVYLCVYGDNVALVGFEFPNLDNNSANFTRKQTLLKYKGTGFLQNEKRSIILI